MKNLLVLMLFVGTINMYAQNSMTDQFASNPFALTYGVDSRLMLFTPDTGAQILFNPARAAKYQKQFVVGKYDGYASYPFYYAYDNIIFSAINNNILVTIQDLSYPMTYNSSPAPTIDAAVLLKNDESNYWLFQFTNIVSSYSDEGNSVTQNISSASQRNNSESHSTQDGTLSKTRFKASRIFLKDESSYSIGIFGYYLPNFDQYNNSSSSKTFNDNFAYVYMSNSEDHTNQKNNNPSYSFGLEASIADDVSDVVVSVKTMMGKNEGSRNTISASGNSYTYTDTTNNSNSVSQSRNDYNHSSNFDPTAIVLNAYYRRSVPFLGLPADMFISATGGFLSGDISLSSEHKNYYYSKYGSQTPTGDTSWSRAAGSFTAKNYSLNISAGILTNIDLDDIQIRTDVPEFDYITSTTGALGDPYSSYTTLMKYEYSDYTYDVLLPLMITYTPTDWCTVFSGINTSYYLRKSNSENSSLPLTVYYSTSYGGTTSYPQMLQSSGNSTNSNYSSTSSIYLNTQFQHKSGLKVQLSFKDDLAKFKEMGVSVAYFF